MNIYAELFFTFMKIGVFTFGGGYAMIPLIDRECSEKREWITSDELSEVTVVAESTPGPIAINCATFIGIKKAGFLGAALATLGVILPSFVIILLISGFMENLLNNTVFANAFKAIRIAVSLLILRAGIKMLKGCLKKSQKKTASAIIALIFFAAVTLLNIFGVNFSSIYLILISGTVGFFVFGLFGGKRV
ncbi:MAG: chromate transporter [Oscillospiraceae bacterium]|nr:chromate transporter [Oscillospiraceae bacterium]